MPFNYDKHADFGYSEEVANIFNNCYCFGTAAVTAAGFGVAAGSATAANLALIGTIVSVVGAVSQGQSAAGNARFQSQVAGQNAELARRNQVRSQQQAAIDEEDYRRDSSRALAARRAAGGGIGVLLSEGSFAAGQAEIEGENELNALRLRNQFAVRTGEFGLEAQSQAAQGQLFGAQAKQAQTASLFKAGSAVFSGASSIAGKTGSAGSTGSSLKGKYPSIKGFNR